MSVVKKSSLFRLRRLNTSITKALLNLATVEDSPNIGGNPVLLDSVIRA